MDIYKFKEDCEKRIVVINQEIAELEKQPNTPENRAKIEKLESELGSEYASLCDYKGRIINYEYEQNEDF